MSNVDHDFDLDFRDDENLNDVVDDFDEQPIETVGQKLFVVHRGSRDYVGYIVSDSEGRRWMISPLEMVPGRQDDIDLVSQESFIVDGCPVFEVHDHDNFVREKSEFNLNLAFISNTPVLFKSVEH
ncbi:hypothetical protein YOLOSWAG_205 [Erwinia phage vB_EamM_Yoloswag]|uniref:Uncharacterized protein n=1 Tax=Erwinia phage vB_EamM_Yoloswag TaxID=1958956 RepID=A0A1S6L3C6_9CAUD|nr:hypothetical protein HOR66_gp205 [Erwinia phage vB_EamM_Yoloswag]AQT28683.1 hypothetical protein YOLOSWAG_205 [Erwinia phage vB_EamM_Yoloswag]